MAHEALEGLDAEREFADRQGSLQPEAARPKAVEICWKCVFGPINDPKVLPAPTLHRWLDDPLRGMCHKLERLDHHAFASPTCQVFPPAGSVQLARRVGNIDHLKSGGDEHAVIWPAQLGELFHMPGVILIDVDSAFRRQQMKRREAQIIDGL